MKLGVLVRLKKGIRLCARSRLLKSPQSPYFVIIVVATIAYTIIFSSVTILKHYNFQTYGWDLGIFMQALYTTAFHNKLFHYTVEFPSNPSCSFFGVHFSPFLFLLVPVYRALPYAETLLILQSFFIALGSIVVYKLAELKLGSKPALLLSLAYLLYTPLHEMNWYDFHLQPFIPFLLLSAYYYFAKSSYLKSLLFIVLALSTYEIMPVLIFPFGLYALVKRLRDRRGAIYALSVMVICIGWFITSNKVISAFNPTRWESYENSWAKFGNSPTGIAYNILTRPIDALQHFFTYAPLEKALYLLWLLVPLLFTPSFAPLEFLLLVMPWPVITFLSTYTGYLGYQYTGFVIGQVFIATIEGLKCGVDKAPKLAGEWFLHKRAKEIFIASIILIMLINPVSVIPEVRNLYVGGIPESNAHKELLREVIALIPHNASVLTQNDILPHLAHRLNLYSVSTPAQPPDFILLDLRSPWSLTPLTHIGPNSSLSVSKKLLDEYRIIVSADGILLFKYKEGELKLFIPYSSYFSYQDLPLEAGSLVLDPSTGRVVLASDTKRPFHPFWWHGPWVSLPPGDYIVTFRLKIEDEVDGYLLTLLVTKEGGTHVIARKQVHGFELSPREWTDIKLRFSLREPQAGIEFLGVVPSNITKIYLDYIHIEQISPIAYKTSGDLSFNYMNMPFRCKELVNGNIVLDEGCIVYGPYVKIHPGRYNVRFWLKVMHVGTNPRILLDVVKDFGTTIINELMIGKDDIVVGQWRYYELNFSLDSPAENIEFRVHVLQDCEVAFAKVELVRMP